MHVSNCYILMVILWPIDVLDLVWVYEWVHFCTYSGSVQICKIGYSEFVHKTCCVCSWSYVADCLNDLFVRSDQWLQVALRVVLWPSYTNGSDQMWEYMSVVKLLPCRTWVGAWLRTAVFELSVGPLVICC